MSFVLTHGQALEEGRACGEKSHAELRAVIVGPNSQTFSPGEDPARNSVCRYRGDAVTMCYPNMPADAVVDLASVAVVANFVLLKYYDGDGEVPRGVPKRTRPNVVHVPVAAGRERGVRIGDTVRINDAFEAVVLEAVEVVVGEDTKLALLLSRNPPTSVQDQDTVNVQLMLSLNDVELYDVIPTEEGVQLPANLSLMTAEWPVDDEPGALPIAWAELCVTYRVYFTSCTSRVQTIHRREDLVRIPGRSDPDNPLKYGVDIAMTAAGGGPVDCIAVEDPDDPDDWAAALNKVREGYSIVVLTDDADVIQMVVDLVEHRSHAENGRECVGWVTIPTPNRVIVAGERNSKDLSPIEAIVVQRGADVVVEVVSGNGNFLEVDVREGDVLYLEGEEPEERLVHRVLNEDMLTVVGDIANCDALRQLTIWRKLDAGEAVDAVADVAAAFNSKRIRAVWPPAAKDGRALPGYYACAAAAGLRSAIAPHRDLTGVELPGFDSVPQTEDYPQLTLEGASECGVWVLVGRYGKVTTRRAVTTARADDPTQCDESMVTNLDVINKILRSTLARVMRKLPASKYYRRQLVRKLKAELERLAGRRIPNVGPQLVAGKIDVVRRHVYLDNSLVLNVTLTVPRGAGAQTVEVHQRVIA